MIEECKKQNAKEILYVINDASLKYKGIIPENCWHDPYMTKAELFKEFDNHVKIFGYKKYKKLIGVMGIQQVKNVTLIRHAYILSDYQRIGIGKKLLKYLFKINKKKYLLVGTWEKASWAIDFYQKFGFKIHDKKQTNFLLK